MLRAELGESSPGELIGGAFGADTGVVGLFCHEDLLGPPSLMAALEVEGFSGGADAAGGSSKYSGMSESFKSSMSK